MKPPKKRPWIIIITPPSEPEPSGVERKRIFFLLAAGCVIAFNHWALNYCRLKV